MIEKIMDGKKLSKEIREDIRQRVIQLKAKRGICPGLAVVLVGEDPASHTYVRMKEKACHEVGFYSQVHRLKDTVTQKQLLDLIEELNRDQAIHGILVQLPLPKHINEKIINEHIHPLKDVDGFHPINVGNLFLGQPGFIPCTPKGMIRLLKNYNIPIRGKNAVVIGRSDIVGKPMASLLLRENATITLCHSKTRDLTLYTKEADILVVGVGKPNLINKEMVKQGVVILDAGTSMVHEKLVGDVDYEDVYEKVGHITPVPGGVGPMTIAMLMENTLEAALNNENKSI